MIAGGCNPKEVPNEVDPHNYTGPVTRSQDQTTSTAPQQLGQPSKHQEQDKSSDIEQQPPFGDRKISNIEPQHRGGGVTKPTGTSYNFEILTKYEAVHPTAVKYCTTKNWGNRPNIKYCTTNWRNRPNIKY